MSEDQELLAGIAGRDPEAFRTLTERYAGPVINLAYRFLDSRPDAEEAAQEVFVRLYQSPPQLGPSAKLFTWLYRVTANLCIDMLRRRRRAPQMVSLEEAAAPGDEGQPLREELIAGPSESPRQRLARSELAAAARRAIAGLPMEMRAPLVLSTLEELSHAEIAQILGVSPKAVERRIARARDLLKARLQPYL
ncbi:MAG: RNA polymerase sigma factor [Candidatus Omnitrophica bacterium]|nr:RNA polymerase sigma factor [Candidatus Omnitrophota bacterium]